MAKSDELRELLVQHFVKLGLGQPTCPLCGNMEWGVSAIVLERVFDDDPMGLAVRNEALPVVPMICTRCGFIYHVSYGVVRGSR